MNSLISIIFKPLPNDYQDTVSKIVASPVTSPVLTATTTGQVYGALLKLLASNNGMFILFLQLNQLTQHQQWWY